MLQKMVKKNDKGFTLVELMIVIAIIGVLAAVAIPSFLSYRRRSYNSSAHSDLKNAYTTARAFCADNPTGSIAGVGTLNAYGFRQSDDVSVTVSGTQGTLQLITAHGSGDRTYTANSDGAITNN
jgi:prepilin-type N-terminal cleavage/methylation domain-containing protein